MRRKSINSLQRLKIIQLRNTQKKINKVRNQSQNKIEGKKDADKNTTSQEFMVKKDDSFSMLEILINLHNVGMEKIKQSITKTGLPNSILKSIESEKMLLNESNPLETILKINKKIFPPHQSLSFWRYSSC